MVACLLDVLPDRLIGYWTYVSEGVLMVSSVCRSVRVMYMSGEAYMRAKEAGLRCQLVIDDREGSNLLGLTREGVRGYC